MRPSSLPPSEPAISVTVTSPATSSPTRWKPSGDSVARAVEHLAVAKRPLILAGGGVHLSGAAKTLQSFAEAQSIPVAHTMTGKGAIACTHRLSAGLFGRYDRIANALIAEADCLLVIGCKLGEIATKRYTLIPPRTPLVHLDILSDEFARVVTPTVSMWADAREGILDLHAALDERAERLRGERAGYVEDVAARMAAWREQVDARLTSDEVPINMARNAGRPPATNIGDDSSARAADASADIR